MDELTTSFRIAFELIVGLDTNLVEIVLLSLRVSFSAMLIGAMIGLPLGALVAVFPFPGRAAVTTLLNAMMGLPPVVVGLFVYLLLSRAGPLGSHGILYTPTAMVIAQSILIVPIISALACQTISDLYAEYEEQLRSLGVSPMRAVQTLLWDGRFSLTTAVLAGFGRASAEVGAVIIVGGNINHITRVVTTTIALETSQGNLEFALGLGLVLIAILVVINALIIQIRSIAVRRGE